MKNTCGDSARVAYPLFQKGDGGSQPTSPLQFTVYEISFDRAKQLNRAWHSRLPRFGGTCKISYGAFLNGVCYAIAMWSNPIARMLPQQTWLELRRMAVAPDAPKNTPSWFIKIMIGLIKKEFPNVEVLISYQDTAVHQGTIYKASGWVKTRISEGGEWSRPSRWAPKVQSGSVKIRWQKNLRKFTDNQQFDTGT